MDNFFTILIAGSFKDVPRTLGVIQPLVLFFGVAGTRLLAQSLLGGKIFSLKKQKQSRPWFMVLVNLVDNLPYFVKIKV